MGWVVTPGLVGQDGALAVLRAAVDGAAAGRGGLVLVAGEAGIGKTALVSHIAGHVAQRGLGVLWATCWDGPGAPAYWPWVQIVRGYVEICDPALLRAQLGTAAGELARFVGEIGAVLSDLPAAVGGAGDFDSDQARFRLFDAVSSFLARAASDRPLCVVLDDLQWADASTLLLLQFLARRLPMSAVVVIGCYRDTEVGPDHPLVAEVGRGAGLVELTGLDRAEVARLMVEVGPADPSPELVDQVFTRTGGNPFFVREVTRLMTARSGAQHLDSRQGSIPVGVRQVVEQRLARLPQTCTALLAVAAVVGQEVSGALLARAAGVSAATMVELTDAAVRARVLAEPAAATGPYRFCHDLFRETLYAGLSASERTVLHRRVGQALQQLARNDAEGGAAALAHHFLLAVLGPGDRTSTDGDNALRYAMAAGDMSSARLAFEDAVGHYGRALDGLGAAGVLGRGARLDLLLGRADALRRAGEVAPARDDYQQVARLARQSGQIVHLARSALGVHALGVESGTSRAGCVVLLDEAVQLLTEDTALKAEVMACLARELYLSDAGARGRAEQLSHAAAAIARRVGDDTTLAVCLLAGHDALWRPGTAEQRRTIATEMAAVAHRAGDRAAESEAWLLRASAGLELGDPRFLLDLDAFVRLATAAGQPHHTYLVLTRRANAAIITGSFAEAERLIAEAGRLAAAIGEPDAWNVQTRLEWELCSAQGRRVDAEARLRTCDLPHLKDWYDGLIGLCLLERGERTEALQVIDGAVRPRPQDLPMPYVVTAQWAELGEAAAAAGLLGPCRRFYDALAPYAGTTVVIAAAVGFGGAVDHHLGVLAAALGRTGDAVEHFERAAAMHERLGARPWLARTQVEWAAVLHRRALPADPARAADLFDQARRTAAELGLKQVLLRVDTPSTAVNTFRRVGEVWTVSFDGVQVQLKDAKGLHDLAALLAAPGRDLPATALVNPAHPAGPRLGADPVLDHTAREQYRARLNALDDVITVADQDGDPLRSTAALQEREVLIRELSAAVGLGGRDRRLGDDAERARKAVTARIRDSITRIDNRHPALGAHLNASISTGLFCRYQPAQPASWRT
jgi:tetratricopeptide (TPR) repeat protein